MTRRADRVAATGAAIALAGCLLLPIGMLRANRIVEGRPQELLAGGPAAIVLAALAAVALGVALFGSGAARPRTELVCAAGMLAALGWALAHLVTTLTPDPSASARVSIGTGAWVAAAGIAVLWFAASRGPLKRVWTAAASLVALASWIGATLWGGLAGLSIAREYLLQASTFWGEVGVHLGVVAVAMALAIAIGVPLGVASARLAGVRSATLSVVGLIQTVPSLALLGLLVVPLAALGLPGIGPLPAIIALTLYALLPIVRNTFLGLAGVDPAAIDAGLGMGMTRAQLLWRVEAPLALPLVIEGVRAAAVMTVGIAAVVAFVGVGTLGVLIILGLGYQAEDLILLGAIPVVLIAVAIDIALRALGRRVTSPGIRVEA